MDEVETLIRIEERLEILKQQGEEDGIDEKIAESKNLCKNFYPDQLKLETLCNT